MGLSAKFNRHISYAEKIAQLKSGAEDVFAKGQPLFSNDF